MNKVAEALAWQIGVWDQMAPVYIREIDKRFAPVVEQLLGRAQFRPGQHVLDLGTGTGSVAVRAAPAIAPNGHVTAVDISPEMLALARQRIAGAARTDIRFAEGRAEALSIDSESIDVVLACLSLMYVIDRAAAAREIARVLRSGGQLVPAVWGDPNALTSCCCSRQLPPSRRSPPRPAWDRARSPTRLPSSPSCRRRV